MNENSSPPRSPLLLGVLLAGGLARRMGGGDKGMRTLAGRPILERVVERVRPQVSALILNANGDPARFAAYGLPVVADSVEGFAGPLAGILAALEWTAQNRPDIADVLSVATDCPFLPRDLAHRLAEAREAAGMPLACARSTGQAHPVIGLWPVALRQNLRRALVEEGLRKIDRWTAHHGIAYADFATAPADPFFNANTPEDLETAEGLLRAHPGL